MPEVRLELDRVLKGRLRTVLDDPQRPVTEAELRKLLEEGRACTLILGADLERLERQLVASTVLATVLFTDLVDSTRKVHIGESELIDGKPGGLAVTIVAEPEASLTSRRFSQTAEARRAPLQLPRSRLS